MLRLSGPLCPHLQKVSPARPAARARPTQTKRATGHEGQGAVCASATSGSGFSGTCMDSCPGSGSSRGPACWRQMPPSSRPYPIQASQLTQPPKRDTVSGRKGVAWGVPGSRQAGHHLTRDAPPHHCRPLSQCGQPQTCPPTLSTQTSSGQRPRLPDPCPEHCTEQGLRMSA